MRLRGFVSVAGAVGVLLLLATPGIAQQAVPSVTIAATQSGLIRVSGCSADFVPSVTTPPTFTLTRTGDTSAPLTVSLAWSDVGSGIIITPTSATFAAGSSTVTVTGLFSAVPPLGPLTLTVLQGNGYQLGTPSSADSFMTGFGPICVAPPVAAPPTFTG